MEPLFAPACTSKAKELGFRKEKLVPRDIHGRRDGFENRIPPPTKRRYDSQKSQKCKFQKEHVETSVSQGRTCGNKHTSAVVTAQGCVSPDWAKNLTT